MVRTSTPFKLTLIIALSVCIGSSRVQADWGGMASATAARSSFDTLRTSAVDQQYSIHANGQPSTALHYLLSLRLRDLRSEANGQAVLEQTEWQPAVSLHLRTAKLDARTEFMLRKIDDPRGTNSLDGQSVTAFAQNQPSHLPRLTGRYQWAKNVNDLELQGYDTRVRNAGVGAVLNRTALSLAYDFTDQATLNARSGTNRQSQIQDGQANLTFGRKPTGLRADVGYQFSDRREREIQNQSGTSLLPISPTAGLHAVNPAPEFGALTSAGGLTDANFAVPAAPEFNLFSGVAHNFGLDFSARIELDQLHLYTDSLVLSSVQWSVWVSDDNLNWTAVSPAQVYPFNRAFNRFEIAFGHLTTRWIKIVQTPTLQSQPVYAAELRAFIVRSASTPAQHTFDQRANTSLSFSPDPRFQTRVSGDAQKVNTTQTSVGRESAAVTTDLHSRWANPVEIIAHYRLTRTQYDQGHEPVTTAQHMGVALNSRWGEPLTTRVYLQRQDEYLNRPRFRRVDEGRVSAQTILLPKLRVNSEFVYSVDERFDIRDVLRTRIYSISTMAEPFIFFDLQADYRTARLSADVQHVPDYRNTAAIRGNLRATQTWTFIGDLSHSIEPGRWNQTEEYMLSWRATRTITMSAGHGRSLGSNLRTARQWSAQGYWTPTPRWDATLTFALTDDATGQRITSTRAGINARF